MAHRITAHRCAESRRRLVVVHQSDHLHAVHLADHLVVPRPVVLLHGVHLFVDRPFVVHRLDDLLYADLQSDDLRFVDLPLDDHQSVDRLPVGLLDDDLLVADHLDVLLLVITLLVVFLLGDLPLESRQFATDPLSDAVHQFSATGTKIIGSCILVLYLMLCL